MIGLVDCNNFFVSCERVFRPELIGKPVLVLSNNDGCAAALSNEAKALGYKRGDAYFKVRETAERQGVIAFSGNHRLYGDMSRRVMTVLRAISRDVEVYSVDEGFIHLPPDVLDYSDYGRYVARTVRHDTGIPVSVGIAPTKTLAKIASRFAKKWPGYRGACVIDTEEKRRKALSMTAVEDVWGIGRAHRARLAAMGVTTALQLADLHEERIRRMFSIVGVRTWLELNSVPSVPREECAARQTITSSRSFARDLYRPDELRTALAALVSIAARRMRDQGGYAHDLEVFICTNPFHEHDPQYFNVGRYVPQHPTDDTPLLLKGALTALASIFRSGYGYKRAGVTITRITPGPCPTLFTDVADVERRHRLMRAMDRINDSPGCADAVRIASMGAGLKEVTRREHQSRLFTTRLSDIITVNA